jgi:hypothetical protein
MGSVEIHGWLAKRIRLLVRLARCDDKWRKPSLVVAAL